MAILLDLTITIFAYMIAPFIVFFRNEKYDNVKKRKFILYNSIIVALGFIAVRTAMGYEKPVNNFLPALFYYYINKCIWIKKESNDDIEINETIVEEENDETNVDNNNQIPQYNLTKKEYGIILCVLLILIALVVLFAYLTK